MKKRVWALLDNRMGSVGQIRGITGIMNPDAYEIVEKQLVYNRWANLPNLLKGCSLLGLTKQSKTSISKDFPELVISASRRTATAALWIKKQSPQTKVIQLLHPDVSTANLKLFDRIFCPNMTAISSRPEIAFIPQGHHTGFRPKLWKKPKENGRRALKLCPNR